VAKVTIGIGIALIALGLYGYFAVDETTRSWTALIPAIAGALLAVLGFVALDPDMRKHAMHAAAVVALLGFLAPLGRIIPQTIRGNTPSGLAGFSQVTMAVLCLIFLILCVRSFVNARKAREGTV
jgi:peptidoglycan/LPS O-acetylase OafA/YrhL